MVEAQTASLGNALLVWPKGCILTSLKRGYNETTTRLACVIDGSRIKHYRWAVSEII